jgi:hypothetical protein
MMQMQIKFNAESAGAVIMMKTIHLLSLASAEVLLV